MAAVSEVLRVAKTEGASRPSLERIELFINPLAGHVGPGAAAEAQAILGEFDLQAHVRTPAPEQLSRELKAAVEAGPDLVIVLAGDGTARSAASHCGADGPLLAPLAGGTMNMLPHALYGPNSWQAALRETLERGVVRPVSGGEVDGQRFHVAAIIGPPALWAEVREAARTHRLITAWRKAGVAWERTFRNHVTFSLDGGATQRAEALSLICPLVSRAMPDDEPLLEVAALHTASLTDAMRLGMHALLSEVIGDWRNDPSVEVTRRRSGMVWAEGGHVHAVLDGEPMRLGRRVKVGFVPVAFRALAPAQQEAKPEAVSSILPG